MMWQICGESVNLSCNINGFYSLSRKRSRVQVPSLAPLYFQALSGHFIFRSAANHKNFATNAPRLKPAEFRHSLICSLWRCGEFVARLISNLRPYPPPESIADLGHRRESFVMPLCIHWLHSADGYEGLRLTHSCRALSPGGISGGLPNSRQACRPGDSRVYAGLCRPARSRYRNPSRPRARKRCAAQKGIFTVSA